MSIEFKAKINVLQILKQYLFEGRSGKYLDIVCFVNKDGKSKYGDDGFVVQEISKEAREKGEKGPIIGNWRWMEEKPAKPKAAPSAKPAVDDDSDEPPF
jgi:hypothetical protein